jgi:hypothetical protein
MNSKQRRRDRRQYKFQITLGPNVMFDYEKYLDQFKWCRQTFGPTVDDGWRCKPHVDVDGDRWQFDSPEKLTAFALRWIE